MKKREREIQELKKRTTQTERSGSSHSDYRSGSRISKNAKVALHEKGEIEA